MIEPQARFLFLLAVTFKASRREQRPDLFFEKLQLRPRWIVRGDEPGDGQGNDENREGESQGRTEQATPSADGALISRTKTEAASALVEAEKNSAPLSR